MRKLRFISKYGRNSSAKIFSYNFQILLMGFFHKALFFSL